MISLLELPRDLFYCISSFLEIWRWDYCKSISKKCYCFIEDFEKIPEVLYYTPMIKDKQNIDHIIIELNPLKWRSSNLALFISRTIRSNEKVFSILWVMKSSSINGWPIFEPFILYSFSWCVKDITTTTRHAIQKEQRHCRTISWDLLELDLARRNMQTEGKQNLITIIPLSFSNV